MTIAELKGVVPKHVRGMITERIVGIMNQLEGDHGEDFAEHYKQNFVSFSSVMKSGKYGTDDYMSAVKFVSHKLLQNSDIDSYQMTFPDRYQRLMEQYIEFGDEAAIRSQKISPFVSAYKSGELVVRLIEQSLVPPRILNAPMFQQALNIQLDIAINSGSDVARTQAANSILTHLKQPETQKIELEVGIKGQDELEAIRTEMSRLAYQQQNSIELGMNTSLEIAESTLLHEIIDVGDE
jgi:hypothetical protein